MKLSWFQEGIDSIVANITKMGERAMVHETTVLSFNNLVEFILELHAWQIKSKYRRNTNISEEKESNVKKKKKEKKRGKARQKSEIPFDRDVPYLQFLAANTHEGLTALHTVVLELTSEDQPRNSHHSEEQEINHRR